MVQTFLILSNLQKKIEKIIEETIMNKKTVLVNVGPNNVHDILDEVRSDH